MNAEQAARKNAYKKQYDREHYQYIQVKVKPDDAEMIKSAAAAAGQSNIAYILQAVRERMAREAAENDI